MAAVHHFPRRLLSGWPEYLWSGRHLQKLGDNYVADNAAGLEDKVRTGSLVALHIP